MPFGAQGSPTEFIIRYRRFGNRFWRTFKSSFGGNEKYLKIIPQNETETLSFNLCPQITATEIRFYPLILNNEGIEKLNRISITLTWIAGQNKVQKTFFEISKLRGRENYFSINVFMKNVSNFSDILPVKIWQIGIIILTGKISVKLETFLLNYFDAVCIQ